MITGNVVKKTEEASSKNDIDIRYAFNKIEATPKITSFTLVSNSRTINGDKA